MDTKIIEEKVREFKDKFTYGVLYSASSDLSAGEGTHFSKDNAVPAIDWLSIALMEVHTSAEQAGYERAMGEAREKIRNMPKLNIGTIQYEEKYVRWNSFGREIGVDEILTPTNNNKKVQVETTYDYPSGKVKRVTANGVDVPFVQDGASVNFFPQQNCDRPNCDYTAGHVHPTDNNKE